MSEDEKNQMVVVRVPKEVLESFDKTCPKGLRAERIRELMQQEAEKAGNQVQIKVNYEKLKSDADRCRREMERLEKVMDSKKVAVERVALRSIPLEAENIPLIIQQLHSYSIKPEDDFDRGDAEDYIQDLEFMQTHANLLKELDIYRKANFETSKSISSESPTPPTSGKLKRRYIGPHDLCGCGIYETRAEHNSRCLKILDETNRHNREAHNDPLNIIRIITTSKYGWMHIDKAQKVILCSYLKEHNLPYPKFKELGESIPEEFESPDDTEPDNEET